MLDRNGKIIVGVIGAGCVALISTLMGKAINKACKKSDDERWLYKEDMNLYEDTDEVLSFIANIDKFKSEVDENVQKAVVRNMSKFCCMTHPVYVKKAISEGCPVLEFTDIAGNTHLYKYVEKDDTFTHNCIEDI